MMGQQQTNDNRVDFITPEGRLVGGSPFEFQDKDAMGNPLTVKTGPNAGQSTVRYFMALAIPKTNPEVNELLGTMWRVAQQGFPSLFDASGQCVYPEFSWKYDDGDSTKPNKKGVAPCTKEGYPGNWIFKFSGSMPPKVYTPGGERELTDTNSVKRGHFIRIGGSVRGNSNTTNPGIYMNYRGVEFVGYGEEIIVGANPREMFSKPAQLPQGASATPLAPKNSSFQSGMQQQGMPQQQQGMPQQQQGMPQQQQGMPQQQQGMPQQQQGIQQNGAFMAPTSPEEGPNDTFQHPTGQAVTRSALQAAGWSPAEINALQRC